MRRGCIEKEREGIHLRKTSRSWFYGLITKCVGYMGLAWADRRNNTHTLPITRQLWADCLQSGSFISVLSVVYDRFKRSL